MLKALWKKRKSQKTEDTEVAKAEGGASMLGGLSARYESWRFQRDVAAIMAALDRLSDRRLGLIGVRREALFDSVADMMRQAAHDRDTSDDIAALLDAKPETVEPRPAPKATKEVKAEETVAA